MECGEQVENRTVKLEDITGGKEMEGFYYFFKSKNIPECLLITSVSMAFNKPAKRISTTKQYKQN